MRILQTIISYLAIAAAFISSCFSWGESAMIPYTNDYKIPDTIPEYSVISTSEKTFHFALHCNNHTYNFHNSPYKVR